MEIGFMSSHYKKQIIASAIKFYITSTKSEVVLCGRRHGDIFLQLKLLGFKPREDYREIEQGFINNQGKFLTRKQAYKEALNACQITEKEVKELYSEDLW